MIDCIKIVICNKYHRSLTIGKAYKVIAKHHYLRATKKREEGMEKFIDYEPVYCIIDDFGEKGYYDSSIFIDLEEWRDIQLKELGI